AVAGKTRDTEFQARSAGEPEPAFAALGLDVLFALAPPIGIERAHHILGLDLAASDRRQHILDARAREPRQRLGKALIRPRFRGARESALHHLAPKAEILLAHGDARGAADRRARLAGDDDRFPSGGRMLSRAGDDLNLVAGLQFGDERRGLAIDLAA